MKVRHVEFAGSASGLGDRPGPRLPEVAFIGPSNVGKSSLLNSLLGRKGLAKVSRTPGRTQLLNFFRVNESVHFVDLPGYGFAKMPKRAQEKLLRRVEEYLGESPELRLLLWLLDCRRTPSVRDRELAEWVVASRVPHLIVLTKADKLSRSKLGKQVKEIRGALEPLGIEAAPSPHSSQTGLGTLDLWKRIDAALASKGA